MTPWGTFLRGILDRKGISVADFSRLVKYSDSGIHEMINGKRTPPRRRAAAWADALMLNTADTERFIELTELMHAPAMIRDRYLSMQVERESIRCYQRAVELMAEKLGSKEALREISRVAENMKLYDA